MEETPTNRRCCWKQTARMEEVRREEYPPWLFTPSNLDTVGFKEKQSFDTRCVEHILIHTPSYRHLRDDRSLYALSTLSTQPLLL
jgi:hypothetical protein